MKCPKCNEEMEKGIIGADGHTWHTANSVAGKLNAMIIGGTLVYAWKCPKCKKIELEAE